LFRHVFAVGETTGLSAWHILPDRCRGYILRLSIQLAFMRNSPLLPYFLIITAGVVWGSTFSLALVATADGTHPMTLTTWQVVLSAILFFVVCLFSKVPVFRLRRLPVYILIAMLGIVVPDLLYYFAAPHLNAGILSITVSTVPLFTYAIMWAMRFEPLILKRAFGIVLGMIAILLLVLPDQQLSSIDANFWILAVVLCSVCYSIENVYISEGIDHSLDIREILCGSNIVASLVMVPATELMGLAVPVSWLFTPAAMAISAIAVFSTTAYMMFFYAIKTAGPVFASQCAYIVTISGVLWGIVIFAETHSLWVWLSVVVMMAGLALVTPTGKGDKRFAPQARQNTHPTSTEKHPDYLDG
jgi:drug/metabolite transporter (DMT)-like permease